jgi:hypothetical protein
MDIGIGPVCEARRHIKSLNKTEEQEELFMKGKEMVRYTFNVTGKVTVTLPGKDTNGNYETAMDMAVKLASDEIDDDWLEDGVAEEFTDYEEEAV